MCRLYMPDVQTLHRRCIIITSAICVWYKRDVWSNLGGLFFKRSPVLIESRGSLKWQYGEIILYPSLRKDTLQLQLSEQPLQPRLPLFNKTLLLNYFLNILNSVFRIRMRADVFRNEVAVVFFVFLQHFKQ